MSKRASLELARQQHELAEHTTHRAAMLIRGGLPTAQVWDRLGNEPDARPELGHIADAIEAGVSVPEAIAAVGTPAWRLIAATWAVAERSGVAMAPTLERISRSLHALARLDERRSVLLTAPRSTMRLVLALPPLTLLFGMLLGFDPIPVLMSPLGALLICLGSFLLLTGSLWAKSLIAGVASQDSAAGFELELTAIAAQGSASLLQACRSVADSADQFDAEWIKLSEFGQAGIVQRTLASAYELGSPVGPLLLGAADTARAAHAADLERATERLAIRVLIPLGACVLPAFIVLGVVPMLISMMGGVGSAAG